MKTQAMAVGFHLFLVVFLESFHGLHCSFMFSQLVALAMPLPQHLFTELF
jgi:hypothetical protein